LQRFNPSSCGHAAARGPSCAIWLHEHDTDYRLAAQAGPGGKKPELAHMRFAPGEGAVGRIMEHLTPLQIPDLQVRPALPGRRAWAQGGGGLLSFVGVPLMLDDVADRRAALLEHGSARGIHGGTT